MDIISYLKSIGGVLASVTTLVYVTGYLALRARAFTLGTDPAFTLAYEGYVFAGFRFLFISLVILLILSPVILAVRYLALWLSGRFPGSLLNSGQWLLLVLLAVCTLYFTISVLSAHGVLLEVKDNESGSLMGKAVMGGRMALTLMFAVLLLAALSALWLKTRMTAAGQPLTWVLGIVVAIQLFLLPIFHGALYADRMVRVLAAPPGSVKGLKEPLGIVDRTSSHVTLLGLDLNDERRLVTVKLDELNGIPVERIVTLEKFVQNDLAHARGKKREALMEKTVQKHTTTQKQAPAVKGFFEQLRESLHVAFLNIGSLGEGVEEGQVWSVELDPSGKPSTSSRLSEVSGLAWPVLGPKDQAVYAIRQGLVVRLGKYGRSVTEVNKEKKWTKLFGVTDQGDVLGMVDENGKNVLATLHADGKVILSPAPKSGKEKELQSILEQENRAYDGNKSVYVERSARGGRGFDIFYKKGDEVYNVSDCGHDECGQPSLTPDFRRILYVRKSRY